MWYRRHKLNSTITRTFCTDDVAPLNMALLRSPLFEQIKVRNLMTSIGHKGPGKPRSQRRSGWHPAVCPRSFFSSGPYTEQSHGEWCYRSYCDQDANSYDKTKEKTLGIHSSWGHHFSYISLHKALFLRANPSLNTDISCLSNQTRWKNTILVHFIHSVSFTCTWVHTCCTSEEDVKKQAHRWHGGGTTDRLVKYSSNFIPPSDPPFELLPTPSSNNDISGWFLKRAFGSFQLKYCSALTMLPSCTKRQKSYLKMDFNPLSLFHLSFFCFYF